MDRNGNAYTFIFSAIMVVVVALLLAFAAEGLKPFQKENVRKEKMQNILSSVGKNASREEALNMFQKYITAQMVLDGDGNIVEGLKENAAFEIDVLKDYKSGLSKLYKANKGQANLEALRKELKNFGASGAQYPLFVCTQDDGKINYIVPLVGTGLWGPIWGFMAFDQDMNTCVGATFDHKTETPGLGAEIKEGWFQEPFIGKKLFDQEGQFQSIKVVKGGAQSDDMHGVDAISGGTITSVGVSEMIERTLAIYKPFFQKK